MPLKLSASALWVIERRATPKRAVLRHVEEISGNIAASCRYYSVSWQARHGWLGRYKAKGLEGVRDRSGTPHHSPNPDRGRSSRELWVG